MKYVMLFLACVSYVLSAKRNCTEFNPKPCYTEEQCKVAICTEPTTCPRDEVLKKLPCKCCRECVPTDCQVDCAAVQCSKPICPRGQLPTSVPCQCCPQCLPATEPNCKSVKCPQIKCRKWEIEVKLDCYCCPFCSPILP
ncbi:uncharacterized protein DDB_G0274171-like [Diabrotica virgifera virgifera]|uniref:Uncharacterized protein n=1 Tax=Diabrotica virgifera virgifera TaxID=50390 RepID=A0ABM5L2S8_DIAVI|nr:uncharacterized protein DDB_G0274171-like [Diabrotica virgifera virgifera]